MKRLSLLVILALGLSSCVARDYATSSRADVILRINTVNATAGGGGALSAFLQSDVETKGSVFPDTVTAELEAIPKNPLLGTDLAPSNNIILQSYSVQYLRSDGRNVEGVDVPYAITGSLAAQVDVGGKTTLPFVVVRDQAKLEPPLKNLSFTDPGGGGPGSVIVDVSARITLYGKTTTGKDVSATFSLEITFADFPDAGA